MTALIIDPEKAPLSLWRRLLEQNETVALADRAWPNIERSRRTLEEALRSGRAVYGVNTGLASSRRRVFPPTRSTRYSAILCFPTPREWANFCPMASCAS